MENINSEFKTCDVFEYLKLLNYNHEDITGLTPQSTRKNADVFISIVARQATREVEISLSQTEIKSLGESRYVLVIMQGEEAIMNAATAKTEEMQYHINRATRRFIEINEANMKEMKAINRKLKTFAKEHNMLKSDGFGQKYLRG